MLVRRSAGSIIGLALFLLSGVSCTGGHLHSIAGTGVTPLTPAIPGVFRTGTNACGNPYAISATTVAGTVPLLDCPGLAGLHPTPSVAVAIGGEVTISGLPTDASITATPSGLLQAHGVTFVAVHSGTTVVTVHGYPCEPDPGNAQPSTCPLLRVQTE